MFEMPSAPEVLTQRKPLVNRRRIGAVHLRLVRRGECEITHFSSFRGARQREPGIHNHLCPLLTARRPQRATHRRSWLWIPGLRQEAHPGMTKPCHGRCSSISIGAISTSTVPAGTVSPTAHRMASMRPGAEAFRVWINFMASICSTGVPCATASPIAT